MPERPRLCNLIHITGPLSKRAGWTEGSEGVFTGPSVIGRLRGERYRTAQELRELLAQAGFAVLEQRVLPDVGGSVLLTISRSSSS